MESISRFTLIILLVLLQVTVAPINIALAFLVIRSLLDSDFQVIPWVLLTAFLVSLFGNLNFGIVVIAFTLCFFVVFVARKLIPENKLAKIIIVISSIPLANVALLLVSGVFK